MRMENRLILGGGAEILCGEKPGYCGEWSVPAMGGELCRFFALWVLAGAPRV